MHDQLLYFNPSAVGGLADYAHEQANALVSLGAKVTMLTVPRFNPRSERRYQVRPVLAETTNAPRSRLGRRILGAACLLKNFRTLRRQIEGGNHNAVLLGAFSEYLAPLWSGQFRSLARKGVNFGAIVHDPVRDYVVGPLWWHRSSIAAAYSFLRDAFVHEAIQLDTVRPVARLRTTVIPHGPFEFSPPTASREEMRQKLEIPHPAFVLLSFGHIRDAKNLDLAIRALPDSPETFLVVAGKEQSSGQKPVTYYQDLAKELRVDSRCRWLHGHVPANEIGNLFVAADLILLTYSSVFRSASGVLNVAVQYRKPCLASAGGGNLKSVVEQYALGWFIEPDSLTAIRAGLKLGTTSHPSPRWEEYVADNSWTRNAALVKGQMLD